MKEELESIGKQFISFLNDIREADYQVAITTTDIVAGGGQFLAFSNGKNILANPQKNKAIHRQNIDLFREAITQPVQEEAGDERGIYAMNLALDNRSQSSFFRPHSLLLVVIVSDEDERSYGGVVPKDYYDVKNRVQALELYDQPEVFFQKVTSQYKFSIVAVHSIIVPPGDLQCENDSGGIPGRVYAMAAEPDSDTLARYGNIRRGHIGSICSRDYKTQLGPVAYNLDEVPPVPLPCFPVPGSVYVKVEGRKVNIHVEGRQVQVTDKVPFGVEAHISFRCQPTPSQ